jgi:hypothetical protein
MLQEAVKPLLALRCIGQRILPALLVGMAYISRNHSLKTTDVVVATVRGLLPRLSFLVQRDQLSFRLSSFGCAMYLVDNRKYLTSCA